MHKFKRCILIGVLFAAMASQRSQAAALPRDYSVQITAAVATNPPGITLSWPADPSGKAAGYTVYRKAVGAMNWGEGTKLPGAATNCLDTNVTAGAAYEYQVHKVAGDVEAFGYITVGVAAPLVDQRGTLILLVDQTQAAPLAPELARLQQDLAGDGWTVRRHDVPRDAAVTNVKQLIQAEYAADPANVKAVFLFGHLPVPYAGNIAPDGHSPEHHGAWPADAYYGDVDGAWTDRSITRTTASDPRNHNVPGDRKFDQSALPSGVELQVGRVDLANLPGRKTPDGAATFAAETELLRQYLNKNHRFRQKQFTAPNRALIGDAFGVWNGEAFAAGAYRNLTPLVGLTNLHLAERGRWVDTLKEQSHLLAFGSGPGTYTSIEGLGNSGQYQEGTSSDLVAADIKAVFVLLMGSWLGDWDTEDNLMRSVLAAPSQTLACALAGRPHWFLHHLGIGETIGYAARLTQNNGANGLYRNHVNATAGSVHVALMGDPTLRLHPVAPPSELTARADAGGVSLSWNASADAALGYHVYRSTNALGPFTRLTEVPVNTTTLVIPDAAAPDATYMVRAVKLESTSSGTYSNASQGAFATVGGAIAGGGTSGGGATNAVPAIPLPVAPGNATNAANPGSVLSGTNGLEVLAGGSPTPTAPSAAAPATPAATQSASDEETYEAAPAGQAESAVPDPESDPAMIVNPPMVADLERWVDDALPAGADAREGGEGWNWVTGAPAPVSGDRAHQIPAGKGWREHAFTGAVERLAINADDVLCAYVFLDPQQPPRGIMVEWHDGETSRRAFWGEAGPDAEADGADSRHRAGPLPATGKWVLLKVPATELGLEGRELEGMTFAVLDGKATWDAAGKLLPLSETAADRGAPAIHVTDYTGLRLPANGQHTLHVLAPTLLELQVVSTKGPDPARPNLFDFANGDWFQAPSASEFAVTVNGKRVAVEAVGFKRRPIYAPVERRDLRLLNQLVLRLAAPVADNQVVEVKNPGGNLWPAKMRFAATAHPLRYSPAIHVNQEGYLPGFTKEAMVGYYLGSLGEMPVPAAKGFRLVNTAGATVFQGRLTPRRDVGFSANPTPYRKVFEADFSAFQTPGTYRLVVPGLGASLPFRIDDGVAMNFARAYALGMYHQRCGTDNALPFTRFTHGVCHQARASVPLPAGEFGFTWNTIAGKTGDAGNNPRHTAPRLTDAGSQRYPFARKGKVDVAGGHHDAGDYSKYTANSAMLVHYLMFAADGFPGVAGLDNLGVPNSGNGIPDILEEAKWEADFLAKLQDTDGGFYFLVYPREREYEWGVTPDKGDPQVVWPKNTAATAAGVAALAQCASSPLFKRHFPDAAAVYLRKARLGWQFLMKAIDQHGKDGAYQKLTHYGDLFLHDDELAWAACELYLATGEDQYHQKLKQWFNPADPETFRWGWWRMAESYGAAIRSYAFANRTGRLPANKLDAAYLNKCRTQVIRCAEETTRRSVQSAYGSSLPAETKAVMGAGWYFSSERAFDITVGYQLAGRPEFLNALLANLNYEGGCNPVNVAFVTGLGVKRTRDVVHQFAIGDARKLAPSGIPVGNITSGFMYIDLYKGELSATTFPSDGTSGNSYPLYDRWSDGWNVSTEFVVLDQARALGSLAFLAAMTPLRSQAWRSTSAAISVPANVAAGSPVTARLQVSGLDVNGARVVWEARNCEPAFGSSYTFVPRTKGRHWIEAEATWPDGRRVSAAATVVAN